MVSATEGGEPTSAAPAPSAPARATASVPVTGADLLVECLVEAGVSTLFGVPGDTGVAFYDALYKRAGDIRHVLARDERHAAFMADAYARTAGTVGVVEVSSGGGGTFAVGGLGEAYAASVPVLIVVSDIHAASRGTGALTELDQEALFSAVTKWRTTVESAADIPAALAEALRQATTGRPAPVALIVPENVLDEAAAPRGADLSAQAVRVPRHRPAADPDTVAEAARALASARRPAIVAGSGVHWSQAWGELLAFAERHAIPVATTVHGKGAVPEGSPWYLGIVGGNGGSAPTNAYLAGADVVLFVGTRANATDTNSWTAPPRSGPRVIQVDIEPERAGRNYPGSLGLAGDAREVLRQLREAMPETPAARPTEPPRLAPDDPAGAGVRAGRARVEDEARAGERLSAADVIRVAWEALPDSVRVVADPGTPTPHVASEWRCREAGRTVLAPRGHGPMGYAIPAAVGIALAAPGTPVLALVADGSFSMACGELETVCRLDLPVTFVQLTNDSLGWIKMLQHLYTGRRYFGVDPGPTDAVLVAQACGLTAERVRSLAHLREALRRSVEAARPTYIDVPVRHLIDDVPPVASWHAALAGDTTRPTY